MKHKTPLMKRRIATEVIDFQDNSFGTQLETIVSTISNKIINKQYKDSSKIKNSDEVQALRQAIYSRIGLTTTFITHEIDAAIIPFYSNVNHVFSAAKFDGSVIKEALPDQTKFLKQTLEKQGFVDTENVKLGGIFSSYENKVYMNFQRLVLGYKLSPAEIVAILLHELGHGFYICEYADRFESTNQILANVAKEILSNKKEKNLTYIYKEIKKINPNATEEDINTLVDGNRTIAGYFLYKTVLASVNKQTKTGVYDETSFEQLADNFSTRFGYGRYLISGLEKLYGKYSHEKNRFFYGLVFVVGAWQQITIFLGLLSLFTIGPMVGVIGALIAFFLLMTNGESFKDYTYDDLKIRYQRIRNQYIAQIKEMELSNSDLKGIIDTIHSIDKIIAETHQFASLFTLISNIMFSRNGRAQNDVKEQQLLEQLVHNDLFLQSAHFKTLA